LKLLFVANRVPYPPFRGDKLKIYNLARRLSQRHELHLVTFAQTAEDLSHIGELRKVFREVHLVELPAWRSALNCGAALWDKRPLQVLYFQAAEMQRQLNTLLDRHTYDAVHVQHLRMAPYLAAYSHIPRILDLPDAFSLYWQRRQSVPRGPLRQWFERMEQNRVLQYEAVVLGRYDLSLVCSAEDLEYLRRQHGAASLELLPNGVDLDTFSPRAHDYSHFKTLLFTGNMDYAPNVDAVVYFARQILPGIRAAVPDVRFVIAGQRPVKKVQELACDYIEVTGFVQDLAAVYNDASVMVAPLRFGAGTQNKVLEAMAMGIPVVCSQIGFAGLGIESGQGAFMEPEADGFAAAVIRLLGSEDLRRNTGHAGHEVIRSRFGWDAVASRLEGYFERVAAARG
jgi:sugar transferase (PEP-CTERM/EpsH1 system associated)